MTYITNFGIIIFRALEDTRRGVIKPIKRERDGVIMSRKNQRRKKRKFKIILIVELILLVVVVLGAIVAKVGMGYLNNIQKDDEFDEDNLNMSVNSEKIDNYTNFAVFGVDSRDNGLKRGLSDMIMIVSIHNKTKEVKVVSVYRDTYLMYDMEEEKFKKATDVYNKGGAEMSVNMLNNNFDLNITDYVTVNFEAVYKAVDAVGGIDIDISEKEQSDINRYIEELNKINGTKSPYIYDTGVLHLDGIQATAYGRLRMIDTDYKRTERQREVMMALFEKVKSASVGQLKNLVELLSPMVLTSMKNSEILDLALDVASYEIVDQTGFPFEKTAGKNPKTGKDCVYVNNLELSVKQLHFHLFEDEEYEPSDTVKDISAKMDENLGREANTETTFTFSAEKTTEADTKAAEKTKSKKDN